MSNIRQVIQKFKDKSDGKYLDNFRPEKDFIELYEKKIGFHFPQDYKVFLMETMNYSLGDIMLFQLSKKGNDVYELFTEVHDAWEVGVPNAWLAFATDNENYFCFDKKGVVHYWSHDGVVNESWPDFKTWVKDVWIDGN